MKTIGELRAQSLAKQQQLNQVVTQCFEPAGPEVTPKLPLWPGGGLAPAKPRHGAHAEVSFTGTKGRTGSGLPIRKKDQAIVLVTWPGGSTSRTIKGNLTIRYAMQWCAAFNEISERR